MKTSRISTTTQISSRTVLALLVISAISAVLPVIPVVRAATPALSLDVSSGSGALGDGTVGTTSTATLVTVTGSGFNADQDNIKVGYITLGKSVAISNFNKLTLLQPSLQSSSTTAGNVRADGDGNFKAKFYVPQLQAGTYNIVADYTPTSGSETLTSAVSFTVAAKVSAINQGTFVASGIFDSHIDFVLTGFKSGETVTITPTTFLTTTADGVTAVTQFAASALTNAKGATCVESATTGRCSSASDVTGNTGYITKRAGGDITVTATGQDSGVTASSTFTLNPSIGIHQVREISGGTTTLSIPSAASSLWLVGRNFKSSATANANNITITVGSQTVGTIHTSVVASSSGNIEEKEVTYTQTLGTGQASVKFNGTTYSWTNGNIIAPNNIRTAEDASTTQLPIKGALIVSDTTAPAYLVTDASSYRAKWDIITIFGVGFGSGASLTATYTPTDSTASTLSIEGGSLSGATTSDTNGAFLVWQANAGTAPASYGSNNVITVTGGSDVPTTTIVITQYMLTPYSGATHISVGSTGSSAAFQRVARATSQSLEVTGFKEVSASTVDSTFSISLTGSSGSITTWTTVTDTCGSAPCYTRNGIGDYTFTLPAAPDVAGGTYTLTVTGTTTGNTVSTSVTVDPLVLSSALSPTSGASGRTVVLLTGTSTGVHGLKPSTAYTAKWGIGANATSLLSFTSTSLGQVPPGTQFTAPSSSSGYHIVDIVDSSGTSAIFAQIIPRQDSSSQFTGYSSGNQLVTTSSNLGTTGLTFNLAGAITATPTVGNVGTSVTITASGLQPSKTYYVVLSSGVTYKSFTATSTGTAPSGVTFTWPAMVSGTTAGDELGKAQDVCISTTATYSSSCDGGNANFVLQAKAALNATSASPGSTLTLTASALRSTATYNIIWNYQINQNTGNTWSGTVVGSVVGATDGSATATFTVPSNAAAGAYTIQLAKPGSTSTSDAYLVSPPTLTVSTGPAQVGTNTLSVSTAPAQTTVNNFPGVQVSYTNTLSQSITAYAWVTVQNSAGQTVGVFLGSVTLSAGGASQVFVPFLNLPSGSYTASVFATTTTGISISTISTVSVTV